jgi:hypothetical protein
MQNRNETAGDVEALLTAAAQTTDLRSRSALIAEATASRMTALGLAEMETSVPALEDVMDEPPIRSAI